MVLGVVSESAVAGSGTVPSSFFGGFAISQGMPQFLSK